MEGPDHRNRTAAKRAAYRHGIFSEFVALCFLAFKGYRPVARRFSAYGGEIDLIVTRGGTVAFVEVKARSELEAAMNAIPMRKQEKFARAARAWLARNSWATAKTFRADAVFIVRGTWPTHVEGAFLLDLGGQ